MVSTPHDYLVKIPYQLLLYLLYFMEYLNLSACVLILVLSLLLASTKHYHEQIQCSECYVVGICIQICGFYCMWNVNIQTISNVLYQNMHNIYLSDELTGITTVSESQKCNMTEFDEFICCLFLETLLAIQIIRAYSRRFFHAWYSITNNYYIYLSQVHI